MSDKECIYREDAIEVARTYVIDKCPKYMKEWADKLKAAVIEDFCDDILELPAAPVREVVRGRWEVQQLAPDGWRFCSACSFANKRRFKWNFCPNCGADMRGEEKNRG